MRHRLLTAVAALGAGLCLCAALPPWGWWPLAPVGIAVWIALLGGRRMRARFAVSWLVGVAWFAPSTLWMFQLTAPGYVVGVLLAWGPMVGLLGVLCPPDRRRVALLPALVVLFEWFHWHAPFGGVPLSTLALTQAAGPLLPVARVGGALLLGGAVGALGAALYLAAVRDWRPAAAVAGVVVAVALLGALWPLGAPVRTIRVTAVQGGGPQGTRYDATQAPVVFGRHVEATRTIRPGSTDLVVWPENVVNLDQPFRTHPWADQLRAEAARIGAPIVLGVVESVGADRFTNYVIVVNPDGTLTGRYDKERRVPFGEYVPLRPLFEPIAGNTLPPRDQIPGRGSSMVRTTAGPMAVVISWEVFFGRRVREGVRDGGQVVLNPTNGSSYWLTQVQSQQVAASALRAVESGRWLVQVAPTGFSAFVDPDGGVHQRTEVSEQAVIERRVARLDATTPAQATGDLLPALAATSVVVWVAVTGRRRRDGAAEDEPVGTAPHGGATAPGTSADGPEPVTPPAGA